MTLLRLVTFAVVLSAVTVAPVFSGQVPSPVTSGHLLMIESLFRNNRLHQAGVKLDPEGRVLLQGQYRDNREVSLAFSLAQSVVGVKWTSPVTPENIKVREWAQNLSKLFPTKAPAKPATGNGTAAAPQKFALIVGVTRFKNDTSGKNALKYAAHDAARVDDYLTRHRGYHRRNVTLLINERATRRNIQSALDELAAKAEEGDEVLLYFSSHGAPVYDGSLNVVTYDTVFKNHFSMSDSSFPSGSLREFIERTRCGDVIVVLDVCYSGAAFKGIEGFYHPGSKTITFDDDNQGFSRKAMAQSLLGAKDIVPDDEPGQAPAGARAAGAKVIISASDAGERSWESDSFKASFFTHHFLRELQSGKDFKSAFERSRPRVTAEVRAEKKAEQNPQVISSRRDWGR